MSTKIHITSRYVIKPSSPTPSHLQTFKLSLLSQLIRSDPTPVHLFFRPPTTTTTTNNEAPPHHLKNSLATVLTRFYPLAGKLVNNTHIECNDRGAIYYDARVDCPMSLFLDHPLNGSLGNSLMLISPKIDDQEAILTVQVTTFSCGSIVICAAISHKIADAAAFATFLNCWAAVTRGAHVRGIVYDSSHVFPPLDPSSLGIAGKASFNSPKVSSLAIKRFVFTPRGISALQDKLTVTGSDYRPSRVVALTALIWGTYVRVAQLKNGPSKRVKHVASHAIDFRGRVDPKLPGDCVNNLIGSTMGAEWPAGSSHVDIARIATLMYGDIKSYDDVEYVKRIHVDGSYLTRRSELVLKSGTGEVEWFRFTSNCRVPFYEADFGWGPPCWAVSALIAVEKLCVLLDAPPASGGGVEAWVTLMKDDMEGLERDPFFRAYVDPSCHPINKSKL